MLPLPSRSGGGEDIFQLKGRIVEPGIGGLEQGLTKDFPAPV